MADENTDEITPEEQFDAEQEHADEEVSPRDLPAAPPVPLDVQNIALSDIYELPNIRPDVHGIAHLADSMHVQGQLEPVLLRPAPAGSTHGKAYELVFGNRRKRAAEELGWETIRAEVREVPDEKRRQVAIIENFHRQAMSPTAEARAIYDLKYSADPPLKNNQVAAQLGIDPSQVSHRLKMLIALAPPAPPAYANLGAGSNDAPARQDADDDTETAPAAASHKPSEHEPVRNEHGHLVLPGDPYPAADDEEEDSETAGPPAKGGMDILALVDEGRISGSVAEVIASLEQREEQEKLTSLVLKNDWGVKKASEWARAVKKHDIEAVTDEEEGLGELELLEMVDVVPLQTLRLRQDLTDSDIDRLVVYMQLRNGMDQEILLYLYEEMHYTYETLWDYVSLLTDQQVQEFKRRLAVRYITAAHRFFSIEPSLKDAYALPEEFADSGSVDVADDSLALPGYEPGTLGALPAHDEDDEDE